MAGLDYGNARGERRPSPRDAAGPRSARSKPLPRRALRGYDDERSLALHRMLSAGATTQTFERAAGVSLARYDADGRFGFGEGRRVRLHLSIAVAHGRPLLETLLPDDQSVREDGDIPHTTATVVESQWLWNWIRGFGDAV